MTHNTFLPLVALILQDSGIYLAGTWDGLTHKCSFSNSDHFLDTYTKHIVSHFG